MCIFSSHRDSMEHWENRKVLMNSENWIFGYFRFCSWRTSNGINFESLWYHSLWDVRTESGIRIILIENHSEMQYFVNELASEFDWRYSLVSDISSMYIYYYYYHATSFSEMQLTNYLFNEIIRIKDCFSMEVLCL